uniref:3CxxC-type domain-containing protein n=1 Tax=Strigamia maritima TaxID=126957 RepID=T1IPG4_STRMM
MIPPVNSLVKYDNPVLVTRHSEKKSTKASKPGSGSPEPIPDIPQAGKGKVGADAKAAKETEEILNSIIPPREWVEEGQLWIQQVSTAPATRIDVINLQEQLDIRLQQRQARETGICPVRRELYTQCFDELIRQVTINCAERGLLLLRVRDEIRMTLAAYQTLYESSIAFGMRKALQSEQGKADMERKVRDYLNEMKIQELEVDRRELERQVNELMARADQTDKRYQEQRQVDEKRHADEIQFLKKTNIQLKSQLDGIISQKNFFLHLCTLYTEYFIIKRYLEMVQWIIAEVMADHEVDPEDVVTRFRRHSVFGWGTFKCTECRISWSSQITWVTLDIKEQRIRRRFKQKCKKCGQPQRPWWQVEEFAYMMEFALVRYQKLVSGTWKPTNRALDKNIAAPHKSELCERCGFGTRKCWLVSSDEEKKDDINKNQLNGIENDNDELKDVEIEVIEVGKNSKPKTKRFSEGEVGKTGKPKPKRLSGGEIKAVEIKENVVEDVEVEENVVGNVEVEENVVEDVEVEENAVKDNAAKDIEVGENESGTEANSKIVTVKPT